MCTRPGLRGRAAVGRLARPRRVARELGLGDAHLEEHALDRVDEPVEIAVSGMSPSVACRRHVAGRGDAWFAAARFRDGERELTPPAPELDDERDRVGWRSC